MTPGKRLFVGSFLAAGLLLGVAVAQSGSKSIAITFDDLPVSTIGSDFSPASQAKASAIVGAILATLRAHHVPAMGMVNERKLHTGGTYDGAINAERAKLLDEWTAAGRTLGNHSFAHLHLSAITLEQAEAELLEGSKYSSHSMAQHNLKVHYFRYPFNDTGGTPEKKMAFEAILKKNGYTIAPMTIQNDDWMYNIVYDAASAPDADTKVKLREAYLADTKQQIEFTEKLTNQIFHRPIPQILLIHSNQLNADTLDATLKVFEAHGYTFIDLPTALQDKAYSTPDLYTGPNGVSWLERWRISLLKQEPNFTETPIAPRWVQDAYNKATGVK